MVFIIQKKEWLEGLLRKDWLTDRLKNGRISEGDSYNLIIKYIIRNSISALPGYEYVSGSEIYINEKDRRCYCNI